MQVKTTLSMELESEEYDGVVQEVVKAFAGATKVLGKTDLRDYSRDDIEVVAAAAVDAVLASLFKGEVDIKPPF